MVKKTKVKITKASYHEISDRISITNQNITDYINNHHTIKGDKKAKRLVLKAQSALADLYQHTASKM